MGNRKQSWYSVFGNTLSIKIRKTPMQVTLTDHLGRIRKGMIVNKPEIITELTVTHDGYVKEFIIDAETEEIIGISYNRAKSKNILVGKW